MLYFQRKNPQTPFIGRTTPEPAGGAKLSPITLDVIDEREVRGGSEKERWKVEGKEGEVCQPNNFYATRPYGYRSDKGRLGSAASDSGPGLPWPGCHCLTASK